jgi:hypothetical protein
MSLLMAGILLIFGGSISAIACGGVACIGLLIYALVIVAAV